MNNAELIKALRYCGKGVGCHECPIYREPSQMCFQIMIDAADALEALQAELSDALSAKDTWMHKCGTAEEALDRLQAKMPKEGECIEDDATYCGAERANYKCSLCGKICGTWKRGLTQDELPNYCPACGARMRTVTDCHTLEEGER